MRLVAWNANYNNRRRSFDETVTLVEPLHADVLVLSEVALPERDGGRLLACTGAEVPGLVIVRRNGFELSAHAANEGAPPLAAAYTVHG